MVAFPSMQCWKVTSLAREPITPAWKWISQVLEGSIAVSYLKFYPQMSSMMLTFRKVILYCPQAPKATNSS